MVTVITNHNHFKLFKYFLYISLIVLPKFILIFNFKNEILNYGDILDMNFNSYFIDVYKED